VTFCLRHTPFILDLPIRECEEIRQARKSHIAPGNRYWDWSDEGQKRIPELAQKKTISVTQPGPDGAPVTADIPNPLLQYTPPGQYVAVGAAVVERKCFILYCGHRELIEDRSTA
jgi:hypothetical protein